MTTSTSVEVLKNQRARALRLILLAAFTINAVLLFVALPALGKFLSPRYNVGFMDLYDLIAKNLVQGNGYRVEADMGETMLREPGYPLFLALVFKIGGYHIEAARLANLLLAFGVAFVTMRLTRRVTGDEVTPLIAALLFLFYPGTLISEARGGIEIAFAFAVVLSLLALDRAVQKGALPGYLVAGLLLGLTVLVRSVVLAFPLFLLVYLLLTANGMGERVKMVIRIAVLVLGIAAVMLPWVVRNYTLVREFVPTATVAGVSAQEGQYTCQHLSLGSNFYELQREAGRERNELTDRLGIRYKNTYYQTFYDARDELAFDRSLLQSVAMEYRKEPALLARCAGMNLFFNFWFLGRTWHTTWLNMLVQVPLLALSLSGILVLCKRALLQKMGIMLTFVLYVPLVQAPIIAHARHSMAVVPFLMILASVSLLSIWHTSRRKLMGVAG
jgi:4-amino-4-deoxy-L-arabinose transferase-like glycosyltransferase